MHIRTIIGALIVALLTTNFAYANTERMVRKYYAKYPTLIKIAECESGFRQFDDDGRPLKNPGSSATGVMQLMASYHEKPARRMGLNIRTIDGNLRYALRLYKAEGTRPWKASKHCWG